MSSEGHRYAVASTEGKNYLDGREYPFPLNPQFRPRVPTSEKMREDIHYDWTCGDGLQKLSNKYKLSLQRIEAILKLQDVKARWNKDVSPPLDSSSSERVNDATNNFRLVLKTNPVVTHFNQLNMRRELL